MPAVNLLDDFHSNPKVIAAGNEAAGVYARALSYCGAYLTDGFIPGGWALGAAAGRRKALTRLIEVGLWVEEGDGYRIPDYLDLNRSKAEVVEHHEAKARAGKKGALKRWSRNSDSTSHSETMTRTPKSLALPGKAGKALRASRVEGTAQDFIHRNLWRVDAA